MESINFFAYLIFGGGFLSLVMSRHHLLSMLLSLEFLMLGGYLVVIFSVGLIGLDTLVLFLYLFVVVCEASLGLGVLISLVKGFGGDTYRALNLLQC